MPLAFNLGPMEISIIAMLALLLFGGKRLPGLAKDLGQGIRDFRKSLAGELEEEEEVAKIPPKKNKKTKKS